tara:strand:- start:8383 stop:8766 length:384 start_codon:yes stop_codon:yes gene_type:complete
MNKLFRKTTLGIVYYWRIIMDNRYNPLRHIGDPSLQLYFTLVLFTVWSVYFGFLGSYYIGWLGYDTITSIIVHIAVILPVGFTNAVFTDAERDGALWLRRWHRQEAMDKLNENPQLRRIKWDIDKEA